MTDTFSTSAQSADTLPTPPALRVLRVGLLSISDRASSGIYEDKGLPALHAWLSQALRTPWVCKQAVIADEQATIEQTLRDWADLPFGNDADKGNGEGDGEGCHLILTTGGTGPAPRDVTPEATLAVADKVMPGFGEQMRAVSMRFVPTAMLSRQVGVVRGQCLILNLPGQPKAIAETLEGIFAAVPYCLDLIAKTKPPLCDTHPEVVKSFRPKLAQQALISPQPQTAPAQAKP